MSDSIPQLRYRFRSSPPMRRRTAGAGPSCSLAPPLPRITRLMALAIRLDGLLQAQPELDGEELARRAHVSRTRITQILNLLSLAPDIQEQLLWLPPLARGRETLTEKSLRRLAGEYLWERQRVHFAPLLAGRSDDAARNGAAPQGCPAGEPSILSNHRRPYA